MKKVLDYLKNLSPTTKKTALIAAICALFFILGWLIPAHHDYTPQPTPVNDIAMWKDSIDKAQKTQATLQIKLKKSEANTETLRKYLALQKKQHQQEIARLRTLPPDSLYGIFAKRTGGIDTTAEKTYRIPTENIMQADIIFAEHDYLLKDTTTKYEIINALGVDKNLLKGIIAASNTEKTALAAQRDTYKADGVAKDAVIKEQGKTIKKERNATTWVKIGWVTSEIVTIILFIAL